jgi:hypothetical protein
MKNLIKISIFALFVVFSSSNLFAKYNSDIILKAMKDELNRSMSELKIENLEKPYYIEYKLTISQQYLTTSDMGQVLSNDDPLRITLNVGIRIGDYKFDNSNFFDIGFSFFGSTDDEENYQNRIMPVELTYDNIRREIWLATDAAYKQSSEVYSKKIATLKNIIRKDTIPDFSVVSPVKSYDTAKTKDFDFAKYTNVVKELSKIFQNYSKIFVSQVAFEYLQNRTFYVNSEGMEYVKDSYFSGLESIAFAQKDDGTPVINHYHSYTTYPEFLPNADSLSKAIHKMATTTEKSLIAKSLDEPYNGPVLIVGEATGELISRSLAPNFIAQRQQLTESMMGIVSQRNSSFQKKIGGRVLPEFISVVDNPTINKYEKSTFLGFYKIDDQGIKPETINLVEKGYLKSLLNDRTPTKRLLVSNGHKREGAITYSNLFIEVEKEKTLNNNEIKTKLIELIKQRDLPFGIIITKIANQNIMSTSIMSKTYGITSYLVDQNSSPIIEAYKIYQDGREEFVSNIQISSISAPTFKDIIFAGTENYVFNHLSVNSGGFMGEGSPYIPTSIISPALLFEDLEINPIEKDTPKPPFFSNPILK